MFLLDIPIPDESPNKFEFDGKKRIDSLDDQESNKVELSENNSNSALPVGGRIHHGILKAHALQKLDTFMIDINKIRTSMILY